MSKEKIESIELQELVEKELIETNGGTMEEGRFEKVVEIIRNMFK